MKNISRLLFIMCFTIIIMTPIKAFAISKESLQELIDNKKIEEVVKDENSYRLKVKLSNDFKEIVKISLDDTEAIELLNKNYKIDSLLVNGNDKDILSEINIEDDKSSRFIKYLENDEMSLEELSFEISEENIKEIYKFEVIKGNNEEAPIYRYEALPNDSEKNIKISGDVSTIEIPDSIPLYSSTITSRFVAIIVILTSIIIIAFIIWRLWEFAMDV